MHRTALDVDTVTAHIDTLCRTLALPRFSRLSRGDIQLKSTSPPPNDVVTVIDQQVEERLSICAC